MSDGITEPRDWARRDKAACLARITALEAEVAFQQAETDRIRRERGMYATENARLRALLGRAERALKEAEPWVDHITLGTVERILTAIREESEPPKGGDKP